MKDYSMQHAGPLREYGGDAWFMESSPKLERWMEKQTNGGRGGGGLERKKGDGERLMVRKRVKRGRDGWREEGRIEGEG